MTKAEVHQQWVTLCNQINFPPNLRLDSKGDLEIPPSVRPSLDSIILINRIHWYMVWGIPASIIFETVPLLGVGSMHVFYPGRTAEL